MGTDLAQLSSQVEALTSALARVQDEAEIKKLHNKYGYYLDKCLYKEVAALFADHPDTFVEFLGGRYRRREGAHRLYVERFGKAFVKGRNGPVHGFLLDHAMMQDVVDVDPDGIHARGRFRTIMSAGVHESIKDEHPRGFVQWWEGGVYENEYLKENGIWKLFRYRYFAFWHAEHDKGWSRTKPGYVPFMKTTFPEDPLGPDELVENKFLWPDTRAIPFHYPHPVTGKYTAVDDLRAPRYGQDVSTAPPALSIEDPDVKSNGSNSAKTNGSAKKPKGTIAIEEAIIDPESIYTLERFQSMLTPGADLKDALQFHQKRLLDIHDERLKAMDEEGVDYMLLSLTSPGCQGEHDAVTAEKMATNANDYLAKEVKKNPSRFGALAAISMHDPSQAAQELTRAVKELGMFGGLVNDFQSTGSDGSTKEYFDTEKYDPFWKVVEELDVPIYFHPRYPIAKDLEADQPYGSRKQLLGAAVSFHLDLSFHIYAMCSSGVFDRFPKVQIVVGHLGEGIPFNLVRACNWYNKPSKKLSRPSKQDYKYYFQNNVHITTSGDYNTAALKFCIEELGPDRVLYAIDTPYDSVKQAQDWWKTVDLPAKQQESVARGNAIRLFKLPLEV